MQTAEIHQPMTTELTIFDRILKQGKRALSPTLARYVLTLDFSPEDKDHMHALAVRNQGGLLSGAEKEELLGYARAGCLLGILHSKARKSLKPAKKKTAS